MKKKRKARGSEVKGHHELQTFFRVLRVLGAARDEFFFNYLARNASSNTDLCLSYCYSPYGAS